MDKCSCGNSFDGDNLCMLSACQWEGIKRPMNQIDYIKQMQLAVFRDEIDSLAPVFEKGSSDTKAIAATVVEYLTARVHEIETKENYRG